ncbi:GSCOCG00009289001-RA-CDS [Cotesia congregata]|nr:GSCOCG00009289001-RA-CDS [Cotesia congregata]
MKRGPYKSYLNPGGSGIMPRSTFYGKLKKYRTDIANTNDQISNQNVYDDDDTNANVPSCHKEILVDDSFSIDSAAETDVSSNNQQTLTTTHSLYNSWLFEDFNEQSFHEEIWFDAENSSLIDDHNMDYNNEASEEVNEVKDENFSYHKPLCNCSTITQGEALMMTLALGAEESLPWKTIIAILSMINTLFQNDVVPASKYKLFEILKLNEDILVYHLYCNDCHHYFGAQKKFSKDKFQCPICGDDDDDDDDDDEQSPDICYFLTFDISLQLKSMLEDEEVQKVLMKNILRKNCNNNSNDLRSMRDGEIYKQLSMENNPFSTEYNFSYTFNTGGCKPSTSRKHSVWPIYIYINDLSPKLNSKHMIMAGLWVNKKEPDMLLFLQPFVNEANKLSEKGIEWKLQQQTITSKFIPICASVDSVARCMILNMKEYDGTYGCTFCEHPTECVDNFQKFSMTMIVPKERTDKSIKNQMVQTAEIQEGNDVMGVLGPSPLMNLDYFNIADGMSPDYIDAVLLGVIKEHTEILLSSLGEDYYVGNPNQLEVLNTRLSSFKHPTCITRSPPTLTDRKMWKATEWRSWLLFYSLICFKGILPQKYFDHLAILVEAIHILLSDKINYDELDMVDSMIIRYAVTYQEYFGKHAMTYNIHLLLHMVKSVLKLGPLSYHNTFIFENENQFLMKLPNNTKNITIQIARRYLFQKALSPLKSKINISGPFLQFCERNLTGCLKNIFEIDGCILIDKGKEYYLNDNEQKLVNRLDKCKSFNRIIYNRKRYTSKSYCPWEKIDDSVILLKNDKIGIINNICYFNSHENEKKIYIFYEEVIRLRKYFYSSKNVTVQSIEECIITKNLQFCEVKMILRPCMLTAVQSKHYVIFVPPGCYGD